MEYQFHYGNLAARAAIVAQQEALGRVMTHDDFDPDWQPGEEPHGTLSFVEPVPPPAPTPEQVFLEECKAEINAEHTKVMQAIQSWDSLTLAQKDKLLKLLAKAYIVYGVRTGCFVL